MKNVQGVNDKYYNYYSKKRLNNANPPLASLLLSFT